MPYESKEERELKHWMTLSAVTAHVCTVDHCAEEVAHEQIIKALSDDGLGPLRWKPEKDNKQRPFGSSSMVIPIDEPPKGDDWRNAEICWEDGTVRDDWTEYGNGKWRGLLILRHSVARTWSASVPAEAKKGTAHQETKAVAALEKHLRLNGDLKRDDGLSWLRANGHTIAERAYRGRVWPKAREASGLPARAKPGRKKSVR